MNFKNIAIISLFGISISSCQLTHQSQELDQQDIVTDSVSVEENSETIDNNITDLEKAKQLAWQASILVQNPPHPQSTWQSAKDKWQEAIEILVKIPPEHSDFIEAQQKLTNYKNNYLLIQQQWEKAEQALQLNNKAIKQIESEEYQTAITTLNQAINLNSGEVKLYLNRGVAYSRLNSHQSAIANYNQAIVVNADSADAYYYRGDEYLQQGEVKTALSDYNKVIQLNPNYPEAYLDRGFIYAEMGENSKAVEDLKKAAKLLEKEGDIATKTLALEVAQQLQSNVEINNEVEETEEITQTSEDDVNTVIIKEKEPVIIYRNRRTYSRPSRRTRRRR
ncbi:MAG: tetratricopeptide repeat protein [Microcoleaceae cyanobacterium]